MVRVIPQLSGRWVVVLLLLVVLGSCAAVVGLMHVSLTRELAELNPFANRGISHDLTPVDIVFTAPRDTMRWRIPKAYVTDKGNWQGGNQDFIDIEAGLYWNSPDMPPFAIVGDPRSTGPKPDDEVYIDLRPSGHFSNDSWWKEDMLRNYAPAGTRGALTIYHDVRPRSGSSLDHVFAPTLQAEHIIYFNCGVSIGDVLANCAAEADFSENIWLEYIFNSKYLERWREIDGRVRRLVASFLQSGGGPRAVTDYEP